jgi:hypothetical protein
VEHEDSVCLDGDGWAPVRHGSPMAREAVSSGLVDELLLGKGSSWPVRVATSRVVGARHLASSAFSSVGWRHCLKRMAVIDVLGGGE